VRVTEWQARLADAGAGHDPGASPVARAVPPVAMPAGTVPAVVPAGAVRDASGPG